MFSSKPGQCKSIIGINGWEGCNQSQISAVPTYQDSRVGQDRMARIEACVKVSVRKIPGSVSTAAAGACFSIGSRAIRSEDISGSSLAGS